MVLPGVAEKAKKTPESIVKDFKTGYFVMFS